MSRDNCPNCNREFSVDCTRVDDQLRVRYLSCCKCGTRATTTEIVPLSQAPRQVGPGRPVIN